MKAAEVRGRRIVGIVQTHVPTREEGSDLPDAECGPKKYVGYVWCLNAIKLDDGSELRFSVSETEFGDYYVTVRRYEG